MSEKKQNVKKDIKKEIEEIDKANVYRVCLLKKENAKAISAAYKANDFCKIQEIFVKCNVPKSKMRELMIEVLQCKDGPQLWN